MTRIIGGTAGGRRPAHAPTARRPGHVGPGPRGAVLHPGVTARLADRPALPRPVRRVGCRRARGDVARCRCRDCWSSRTGGRRGWSGRTRGARLSGASRCSPSRCSARSGCTRGRPYDVVFADPPYALVDSEVEQALALLVGHGWLAPGSVGRRASARRAASEPTWPAGLRARAAARSTARPALVRRRRHRCQHPRGLITVSTGGPVRKAVCPGLVRPRHQRAPRHHRRAPRSSSTRWSSRSAPTSRSARPAVHRRGADVEMLGEGAPRTSPTSRSTGSTGLLVDFCAEHGIRGDREGPARGQRLRLRAADGADELPAGRRRDGVHARRNPLYSFLSSSLVKEIASYGGDVSRAGAPPSPGRCLTERLAERVREDRPGTPTFRPSVGNRPVDSRRFCLHHDEKGLPDAPSTRAAPLVLDTRELGRRPGSKRKKSPAPTGARRSSASR